MNFIGSFLSTLKPRYDDDVVDRLNYYYTCVIILVLSLTISAKQYVGQPIQCWVPAQFTGAWEQYAENYCFVQNTYWLPLDDTIPKDYREREARQIGYYQWVPFVLAIQALLFYVPCIIWRLLNWQSGINVDSVVTMAADSKNINTDLRDKAVQTISRHIEDAIELQRDFGNHSRGTISYLTHCGKTKGTYVTLLYLVVKVLYILNVVGQFFLLNGFLGPRYYFWGAEILNDLASGVEWEESGHFPRVTMCDFEVRVLGNLHRYTIQCVLMINMFNEKIFLFLWWWFLIVAAATILNSFYWLMLILVYNRHVAFVMRYLRVANSVSLPSDRRAINRFVTHGLRRDGVFMLRMISNHAGDMITTEITHNLWKSFKNRFPKSYSPSLEDYQHQDPRKGEGGGVGFRPLLGDRTGFSDPLKLSSPKGSTRTPSYEKATAADELNLTSSV